MDLLPAILLAIPITAVLIGMRILIVLQNRKQPRSEERAKTLKP